MEKRLRQAIKNINIRPAGQGSNCDCWYRNPDPLGPYLVRCRRRATRRVVIVTPADAYTLKRCEKCTIELCQKEANGATFHIFSIEMIKERFIPFLGEAVPAHEMVGEAEL